MYLCVITFCKVLGDCAETALPFADLVASKLVIFLSLARVRVSVTSNDWHETDIRFAFCSM